MEVVGLILAGGRGLRLGGVRKADLRLRNRRLLDWVVGALEPQCNALIVSTGDAVVPPMTPLPSISDDPGGIKGPAAGLLAGAKWCRMHAPGAMMVSASVDSPFLPNNFVVKALAAIGAEAGCAVGAYDGRDFPVNALWRPETLIEVLDGYATGPRGPRVRDVQAQIRCTQADFTLEIAENPFAGINTLADLLALSRRL